MAADHTTRTSLRCFVWYSTEAEVLPIDGKNFIPLKLPAAGIWGCPSCRAPARLYGTLADAPDGTVKARRHPEGSPAASLRAALTDHRRSAFLWPPTDDGYTAEGLERHIVLFTRFLLRPKQHTGGYG